MHNYSNNMNTRTLNQTETDKQINLLRMKKTVKELESATGKGTSMISLFIPPGNGQLTRANRMLTDEYRVSANIKSRV